MASMKRVLLILVISALIGVSLGKYAPETPVFVMLLIALGLATANLYFKKR